MKRLLAAALLFLTALPAGAQVLDANGNTLTLATQGPGVGAATGFWNLRLTDGTGFYAALTDAQLRATPVPVSGTFWQATQPVSGTFWQATQPVSGTFWQATQPISGTVTANQGSAAATASAWPIKLTDGTNTAAVTGGVTGASESALDRLKVNAELRALDTGQVAGSQIVALKGDQTSGLWVNVKATVSTPVTGTFWQATQPVSGTFWQATQPVSGTVTLGAGAATIGALTANQSVNVAQMGGVATSMNTGISDTGTQRVTLATELTYSAGTTIKTNTAAGTGPFFALCGSATKTISVQRLNISGTVATAAVYGDVIVRRTSTATSAGTATTLTAAPMDSTSAAATATAKFYTVLATAGTLAHVVESVTTLFPVTVISATLQPTPAPLLFRWRDQESTGPVLRGTAQCLEAAFGTTTTNAPTLSVAVTWTER